jgi:hypothetical protein
MSDDNIILNQNIPPSTQAVQPEPQVTVQPTQPVAPTVSANKETEPTISLTPEVVKPSEAEPQISKDLKELGIEAKKDAPEITDEHGGIVEHAKEFIPVSSSPSNKITMPMSEEEITAKLKAGQDDDSDKWLAKLLKKIIAWGFKSQ